MTVACADNGLKVVSYTLSINIMSYGRGKSLRDNGWWSSWWTWLNSKTASSQIKDYRNYLQHIIVDGRRNRLMQVAVVDLTGS